MRSSFDRRVVPGWAIDYLRELQGQTDSRLVGGAALAGGWLSHRLSRDLDLFFIEPAEQRAAVATAGRLAGEHGLAFQAVQDSGAFFRGRLRSGEQELELDLIHDPLPDIGVIQEIEGVRVASLEDLRASKLTCILSRSEPRDLVDLLFLERAGFQPEDDLAGALQKDAGIDPSTLAWLLKEFPTDPLPRMLEPLTSTELDAWRAELAGRMKSFSLGER